MRTVSWRKMALIGQIQLFRCLIVGERRRQAASNQTGDQTKTTHQQLQYGQFQGLYAKQTAIPQRIKTNKVAETNERFLVVSGAATRVLKPDKDRSARPFEEATDVHTGHQIPTAPVSWHMPAAGIRLWIETVIFMLSSSFYSCYVPLFPRKVIAFKLRFSKLENPEILPKAQTILS